jgi:hypothetical protein
MTIIEQDTCELCHREPGACTVPSETFGGDGDPPVTMCWRCAHVVTEHGATPGTLASETARCACSDVAIFPAPPAEPAN